MNQLLAIRQRWPVFRDKLPEVWKALRDTTVAPSSRIKRPWRLVAVHLVGRPERLSWRTESLRDIRYRRKRREHFGIGERFHRLLHRMHTIQASAALWATVSLILVAVSVVGALLIARQGRPEPETQVAATLVTLTEVVGGAAGILFAVIVFGIQFHGERLGQASYLARYFGRREGLVPIAAFSLAVVTANACVALLSSHGLPHVALPMAYLDYLFVPFVLFLLLFLLHRMVVSVSADIFDRSLIPGLCWEYERAIDEEIHHAGLIKEYEKVLADVGLRYSCGAGMIDVGPVTPVKFTFAGKWQVTDVKLAALRDLAEHIQARCSDYEGVIAIGPGDVLDNAVVFVLSARRDEQRRQRRHTQPVSEECRREIDRMLRRIFCFGRVRERDVVEVLAWFEKTIVSQSRHDRSDQLERGLGVLERLIELRLQRGDSWEPHPSFRRQRLADPLEGFEYYDMAANVVASADRDKVDALLTFSARIMQLALRHSNPALYDRAGRIIVAIYYRALEGTKLADYVSERLDSLLDSVGSGFEYARSWSRRDPQKIAAQMPVLRRDLAWRLDLVRTAVKAGRVEDARNFQDRLFLWDEDDQTRFPDPEDEPTIAAELREACDLLSFGTLLMAAWCFRLVDSTHSQHHAAKGLFDRCAIDLRRRECILRVWETMRGRSFEGHALEDLLGVTRWNMREVRRTGIVVACGSSNEWIERGFMALLLICPSSPKDDVPRAMGECPPFRPKSPDEVRTLADSLTANAFVRNWFLGIADDKREENTTAVATLFAERLCLFKLERLSTVVNTPLRAEHAERLRTEIASHLASESGGISTLRKLGALRNEAISWFSSPIPYRFRLPKERVVMCFEDSRDIAASIARDIRRDEDAWIRKATEWASIPMRRIPAFAGLSGAVREAAERLRRSMGNPIVVYLPHQRRIIEAVIGQRGWLLPNRHNLGEDHIGDWERCHLFRVPYPAPESIVVVNPVAFYGGISEGPEARLCLKIEDRYRAEHEEAMRAAQGESDPTKIFEAEAIDVVVVCRYAISVGLRDPSAALRVELDMKQLGFALVEGEVLYHRPDCGLLSEAKGRIVYTLAHRLSTEDEARTPCQQCRPDDWEAQVDLEVKDATTSG